MITRLKDDYDCVIIDAPDEATAKMPPPSELPFNRRNVSYIIPPLKTLARPHSESRFIKQLPRAGPNRFPIRVPQKRERPHTKHPTR